MPPGAASARSSPPPTPRTRSVTRSGVDVGHEPVEVAPRLFAQQVDARARGERSWSEVQRYLVGGALRARRRPAGRRGAHRAARGRGGPRAPGGPRPGHRRRLGPRRRRLRAVRRDAAPAGAAGGADPVRPAAAADGAPHRPRPGRHRAADHLLGGRLDVPGGVPVPGDQVVEAAERLATELAGVREVLRRRETSVRLVTTAETVVLAETRRTWTSLALHGFRVDQVRREPGVPRRATTRGGGAGARRRRPCSPRRTRRSSRCPCCARRTRTTSRSASTRWPPSASGCWARWPSGRPRPCWRRRRDPAGLDVERVDGGFVLGLDVPLARREELELGRRGDDLVVTVSGRRRVVALPGALRRCQVAGAALRDGRLAVRVRAGPRPVAVAMSAERGPSGRRPAAADAAQRLLERGRDTRRSAGRARSAAASSRCRQHGPDVLDQVARVATALAQACASSGRGRGGRDAGPDRPAAIRIGHRTRNRRGRGRPPGRGDLPAPSGSTRRTD